VARDWRHAALRAEDRALCAFAEHMTTSPAARSERAVTDLRAAGFSDPAIHDAAQVIGYFNYINRIADALGVENESEELVRAWGEDGSD